MDSEVKNEKIMHIGKVYVVEEDDKEHVSLISDVTYCGNTFPIKYTVNIEYSDFLTVERSDAFVVGLLYYCMFDRTDIEWETPCTEQLIFQLKSFFIPTYAYTVSIFHEISLRGDTSNINIRNDEGLNATGMSNGVDGTYTLFKYGRENTPSKHRITHTILSDWFTYDWSNESRRNNYLKEGYDFFKDSVESLNIKVIHVSNNIDKYFPIGYTKMKGG